ncbi:MAG: hypothetical protein R3Y24_02695 [Eubacteriales bacterium]
MNEFDVSEKYLKYRKNILEYTNRDMNLKLQNDKQVYIALVDIPAESIIKGNNSKTLAMIFGLNTHIYFGNGEVLVDLEKQIEVKKAMQSFFISSSQLLPYMKLCDDIEFYNSEFTRVYLKTEKGIYIKELEGDNKQNMFFKMLINNVLYNIK